MLEAISLTPVWMPILFWGAIATYVAALIFVPLQPRAVLLAALGYGAWSLLEYVLHRFLFHFEAKSEAGKNLMFVLHLNHHVTPDDPLRGLFPVLPSAIAGLLLFGVLTVFFERADALAVFFGLICGYCIYDYLHFSFHHAQFRWRWWLRLKRRHFAHHARESHKFGVSLGIWDYVFRTNKVEQWSSKELSLQSSPTSCDARRS